MNAVDRHPDFLAHVKAEDPEEAVALGCRWRGPTVEAWLKRVSEWPTPWVGSVDPRDVECPECLGMGGTHLAACPHYDPNEPPAGY